MTSSFFDMTVPDAPAPTEAVADHAEERPVVEEDGDGDVSKILCPFCSAPWTDDMVDLWEDSFGCESGGWDHWAELEIICSSCNRLIYRKTCER